MKALLRPAHMDEARNELQLIEDETPEMLAAIDEGIRSLNTEGGIALTRAELLAKVRQWAGMLA